MPSLLFSGVSNSPPSFQKILHLKMAKVGTTIRNGEGKGRIIINKNIFCEI